MKIFKNLLVIILITFTITSCNKNRVEVGDEHLGGIVIVVDDKGKNGVIAAKKDQMERSGVDDWRKAKDFCAAYDLGGPGWRLPTKEELIIMKDMRNIIGGFKNEVYWSGTLNEDGTRAFTQNFKPNQGFFIVSDWKNINTCFYCARAVKDF
ncbi:MAG: hypothetical protein EA412_11350 [Chitinophagaceae bacterium]|nr:MAG: hypothetical protein EA412_11350 [Chitinophagaceae bacterium]